MLGGSLPQFSDKSLPLRGIRNFAGHFQRQEFAHRQSVNDELCSFVYTINIGFLEAVENLLRSERGVFRNFFILLLLLLNATSISIEE